MIENGEHMKRELYKFAGVARDSKNVLKLRFCNCLESRTKVLLRHKFTEIEFIELPDYYLKDEAIEYLLKQNRFIQYFDLLQKTLTKYV